MRYLKEGFVMNISRGWIAFWYSVIFDALLTVGLVLQFGNTWAMVCLGAGISGFLYMIAVSLCVLTEHVNELKKAFIDDME